MAGANFLRKGFLPWFSCLSPSSSRRFFGLLSLVLLGGGLWLLWAVWAGVLAGTLPLVAGLAMTALSFLGRPLALLLLGRAGDDDPRPARSNEVQTIERPDGSRLHVEFFGPPDAPPIVLTHAWGCDSTSWYYVKRALADRFRLIMWDLPGLGLSGRPANNNYSLENLARDLEAVLALAGGRPAILVGHSIGGMINLTFCRLFPEAMGRQVAGLVEIDTTYTDPTKTVTARGLLSAIKRPVLVPLMWLQIVLAPVAWLMSWMSYLNGTLHLGTALATYAGRQTRGQLDRAAIYTPLAWPGVLARGMLAMFEFDESRTLREISVPTLIIVGDHDRATNPDASEHMAANMPQAELLTLHPAGHMSTFEQQALVVEALDTFATRTAGAVLVAGR